MESEQAVALELAGEPWPGTTKLYGNPDVPENFEWPCIIDEDDIYDLSFLCQLNLRELADAFPLCPLPKTGMLYFFYDLDAMAFSPFDTTAARVYLRAEDEPLEELCLQDEDGNDLAHPALRLRFAECPAENGPGHRLFGLPRGYRTADYERPISGWVMLLQLDSTDAVPFEDNGSLCFFIQRERLTAGDFSDVRVLLLKREETDRTPAP